MSHEDSDRYQKGVTILDAVAAAKEVFDARGIRVTLSEHIFGAYMMTPVRLTVLSDMAGDTPAEQAEQAARWGLRTLDLKTVAGKNVADLTGAEAEDAATALDARGVGVEAFSTHLMSLHVEDGTAAFTAHFDRLDHVLVLARRLRPRAIRLIAAQTHRRADVANATAYVQKDHPWLLPLYAEAVEKIHAAGFATVIENETGRSIFASPGEIVDFFNALGLHDKVAFTWDVQNLWQLGTFPSLAVYEQLKPFVGYLHLKGGVAGPDGRTLAWRSSLEAASWPVLEITRAVLADGVSPAICLNPSHGAVHPDHPLAGVYGRDLEYLRRELSPAVI